MPEPWIFMGVDRSHFSAKLRPALRYKQIHCVEYPPDMQQIQERTGVGFVPILIAPDDATFQDTTDIIDMLEERFEEPPLIASHPLDLAVCRLFELYADEFFPMVSMRTRWAYPENEHELRKAFAAFTASEDTGNAAADLMSSYLPMLGVSDTSIPAIDAHAEEMLALLDTHLQHHRFLLGDRISLADCALMGPLYAHLYLDRVTRQQLYDTAIHVCMWIERCNRPVPASMTTWFNGDYPESLRAILTLIGDDAAPMLRDQRQAFGDWAATSPRAEPEASVVPLVVERIAGKYQTSLRNVPVEAGIRSYVSWKLQRFADACEQMPPADRAAVRTALQKFHCAELLMPGAAPRLKKDNFQLVYA